MAMDSNTSDDGISSRLLSLADELILEIIEHIRDIQALRNLTLASRKLRGLAEPYVYRDIFVQSGRQALKLRESIFEAPDRAHGVRHLAVRYKHHDHLNMEALDHICGRFRNLKTWDIETPCPNDSPQQMFSGGKIQYWEHIKHLPWLQSIHIHTHFSGDALSLFELANGRGSIIFKSHSMRHIHLACADITQTSVRPLLNYLVKTNLQSLTFEECNIDARALKTILSLPKALKRLTLGERLYEFLPSPVPLLHQTVGLLVEALELQSHSLEYLMHTKQVRNMTTLIYPFATPSLRPLMPMHRTFPDFPELRELDVLYESAFYSVNAKPLASIQKLRVHRIPYFLLEVSWLLGAFVRNFRIFEQPHLKHVELVLHEYRTDRDDTDEEWQEQLLGGASTGNPWFDEEARDCAWELGRRLEKRGIRLTVNTVRSAGFIPPYMHGEVLPVEIMVYDSQRMCLFGNVERDKYFIDSDCARRLRQAGNYEGAGTDDDDEIGFDVVMEEDSSEEDLTDEDEEL